MKTRTFLMEAASVHAAPVLFARIEKLLADPKVEGRFSSKRRRAVVVCNARPTPKSAVREVLEGDELDTAGKRWLQRTILDDLHDEYVASAPVNTRTQAAACRRWVRCKAEREQADAAAERARLAEREACCNLVRTHGKAPVVIDGVMYDPGMRGELVFLIPRTFNGRSRKQKK